MVAARGANDFFGQCPARLERFKIRQPTTNFERADWRVVLVFDPAVGAQALGRQCPAVLRCGLELLVHHACGGFYFLQGQHLNSF